MNTNTKQAKLKELRSRFFAVEVKIVETQERIKELQAQQDALLSKVGR